MGIMDRWTCPRLRQPDRDVRRTNPSVRVDRWLAGWWAAPVFGAPTACDTAADGRNWPTASGGSSCQLSELPSRQKMTRAPGCLRRTPPGPAALSGKCRRRRAASERRAIVAGVTFPLEALSAAVAVRVETWVRLEMRWHTRLIQPNYGKPVVSVELDPGRALAPRRASGPAHRWPARVGARTVGCRTRCGRPTERSRRYRAAARSRRARDH
jgi:hypothetical protein